MDDVVIVTGASSGVGMATALALVEAGCRVAISARRERELLQLAARMPAERVELVVGDLAQPGTAQRLVQATYARFGRIDALVNNAGIASRHDIAATSEDVLGSTFAVNVFGAARLIAEVWPFLCAAGRGTIVNVSSLAAVDPFDGFFVYAASKAAIESFTRSIDREGRAHNVQAYTVRLGSIETPLLRSMFAEQVIPTSATLPPTHVAEVIADCVLGRRQSDAGTVITVALAHD